MFQHCPGIEKKKKTCNLYLVRSNHLASVPHYLDHALVGAFAKIIEITTSGIQYVTMPLGI